MAGFIKKQAAILIILLVTASHVHADGIIGWDDSLINWPFHSIPAVVGILTDAATGEPIESAIVEAHYSRWNPLGILFKGIFTSMGVKKVVTDKDGRYCIPKKRSFYISGGSSITLCFYHPLYETIGMDRGIGWSGRSIKVLKRKYKGIYYDIDKIVRRYEEQYNDERPPLIKEMEDLIEPRKLKERIKELVKEETGLTLEEYFRDIRVQKAHPFSEIIRKDRRLRMVILGEGVSLDMSSVGYYEKGVIHYNQSLRSWAEFFREKPWYWPYYNAPNSIITVLKERGLSPGNITSYSKKDIKRIVKRYREFIENLEKIIAAYPDDETLWNLWQKDIRGQKKIRGEYLRRHDYTKGSKEKFLKDFSRSYIVKEFYRIKEEAERTLDRIEKESEEKFRGGKNDEE